MVWRTMGITIGTCFLLGTTFTHWIADHNVLWRSPLTSEALFSSINYYSLLSSAPVGLAWAYIAIGLSLLGFAGGRLVKGVKSGEGEILFDGGSVVLMGAIAYNQISEVYPSIALFPSPLPAALEKHQLYPALSVAVRDLANDNTITAVMLTGVMLLEAGRWYSKRPSSVAESDQVADSAASSPPSELIELPGDGERHALLERAATPYRELTEEEALELHGSSGSGLGKRRSKKR